MGNVKSIYLYQYFVTIQNIHKKELIIIKHSTVTLKPYQNVLSGVACKHRWGR